MPSNLLQKYDSIQALRAFASVAVVLHHVVAIVGETLGRPLLYAVFQSGFGAVDLFFVISGFIITLTSVKHMGQPAALPAYARKRLVRVYPIYWLVALTLMAGVGLAATYRPSLVAVPYPFSPLNVLSTLLLAPFHIPIDLVSWSLSYEIYFYLLFGLLLVSRHFWWLLAGLLAGSFVVLLKGLADPGIYKNPGLVQGFLLSPYNLEFALGVGLYFWHRQGRLPHPLLLLAGALPFVFFFNSMEPWSPHRVIVFGLPSLLGVAAAIEWERRYQPRFPAWLVHLGDASYVLYLIHFPVLVVGLKLLRQAGLSSPYAAEACGLALAAGLCYLSYGLHRRLEAPLVRWAARR